MPLTSVTELRPGASAPAERAERTVTPYDFRRPTKLSREHVRVLQMAYETFARRLTTVLTSGLRQVCQVRVRDVTQQSYDEYVGGLASPTLMVPVEAAPLGVGALELSLPVAFAAFDHMLGGPGGNQPTRALTDIEASIFRGLVDQMLSVLKYALDPVVPVTLSAGPIEYNPQFLQVASAADAVVVSEFDLVIGAEESRLTLCLPLAPLLPRLTVHKPREATPAGGSVAHPVIRERLSDVDVELRVRFAPAAVDSTTVLRLNVGDVIPLGHKVGAPLDVLVGGSKVAHAIAGKSGNALAALIVDATMKEIQ